MGSNFCITTAGMPAGEVVFGNSMGGFGQLLDMCIALVWLLDSAKRALQNLKAA